VAGGPGWTAVAVDAVEAVPWRGTDLVWRPLRAALGLHAFGAAAYTAERSGQTLVEPHAEAAGGRGHEELYVVMRGRATFTLDGRALDAPAGTCVRVAPATHRVAVAAEVPATVLAFGADPGAYAVAGGEWTDRARPYVATDPARARAVLDEGLAELGETPGLLYGVALLAAAEERTDDAREALRRAIAGAPGVRADAEREPSLAPLLRS
jgi:mannose-6-phosphate isomerase-like protein (cupin superfamily)